MDRELVYSKTPFGEEATRQRTRVVQRNLRMVLLQVDGQLDVSGLIEKIGNEALVLAALTELEQGGYIVPLADAPAAGRVTKSAGEEHGYTEPRSAFEPSTLELAEQSQISQFSTFGLQSIGKPAPAVEAEKPAPVEPPPVATAQHVQPGLGERLRLWLAGRQVGGAHPGGKRGLPVGALVVGILVLLAVLLAVIWPGERERRQAEATLTRALGQPVQVAGIELRLYPKPGVLLRGVTLGERLRCDALRLPLDGALLFGSGRKFAEVELAGLSLPADALVGLPATLARLKSGGEVEVSRLRLKNVAFDLAGLVWADLEGSFEPGGALALSNFDRSLQLKVATEGDKTWLDVEALAWKPLAHSPLFVQTLQARGELTPGKAVFERLDANMLDGRVQGAVQLGWQGGLTLAARLQSERLALNKIAEVFGLPLEAEGELAGALRLQGSGDSAAALWRSLQAEMAATASKGRIKGVDLGEAARRPGEEVRGGATRFDALTAKLQLAERRLTLDDLKLDAGLMQASGRATVSPEAEVNGNVTVAIRSSVATIRAPLRITGKLPVLEATAAK